MSDHDYANCQDPAACALCDAHGDGHAAGKDKALFECAIAACHMSATPECECSPCTALRYAIYTMDEGTPGPGVPAPKVGLCAGCGLQGMLIQIESFCVSIWTCRRCW